MSYNPNESLLPAPGTAPPIHVMAGGGFDLSMLHDIDPQLKTEFLEQTAEGSPCLASSGDMAILSAKCSAIPKVLRMLLRKKMGMTPVPNVPKPINYSAEPVETVIDDNDVIKNPTTFSGDESGHIQFRADSDPASVKPVFGNATIENEKYRIKGTSVEDVVKKYQKTRKNKVKTEINAPKNKPEASPEASAEASPEASPEASAEVSPEASAEASPEKNSSSELNSVNITSINTLPENENVSKTKKNNTTKPSKFPGLNMFKRTVKNKNKNIKNTNIKNTKKQGFPGLSMIANKFKKTNKNNKGVKKGFPGLNMIKKFKTSRKRTRKTG